MHSFEQAALALAFTSANGKILLKANPAFARLHGGLAEALIGAPVECLVTLGARSEIARHIQNATAVDHYAYEARHIRTDGTLFDAHIDVTSVRDDTGKVLYRTLCVTDLARHTLGSPPLQVTTTASYPVELARTNTSPVASPTPVLATGSRALPITENSSDAFWIADADCESLKYLNASFETVWGRTSKGFGRAQWLDSIVPDDHEAASHAFARLAAGDRDAQMNVIYRIRRPDGMLRYIKDRGTTVRDASGTVTGTMGVATDITDRIETDISMREAYEFNRQVMADAQEGVMVLDVEGRCVLWNSFMEQFTGDTFQDIYGRQAQELIPALRDAGFEALFRRVLTGEIQVTPDLHFDRPASDIRLWCVLRLAPRRDAQGRVNGVIGTVQDITGRKQIEAELRSSEARYRNLVERASEFIYETDPSGHFTYFNIRAAKRLFGFSEQELRGMSSLDLVHPEFRAAVEAIYRQQLEQQIPSTYHEFPVFAKDGRLLWLGQNITLLHEGPQVIRRIAVARDITERKRINERRRLNRIEMEGLQDWNVALQTTIALAHELNQPLNAVCSYNEAALRMLAAGNPYPDKLLHALKSSARQSERAGKVMRDLLAFLSKGQLPAALEAIDINAVVQQVLTDMDVELRAGAITLVSNLSTDLDPVLTHQLHIEKVLGNLLRNSIEAIRGNNDAYGSITVKTARYENSVLVTVHDSGPGFTDEQAAKMLEPFYTSKDKGVGMGLPVSRALVEAHGGKLWAENDAGATFRFTLPFAP